MNAAVFIRFPDCRRGRWPRLFFLGVNGYQERLLRAPACTPRPDR